MIPTVIYVLEIVRRAFNRAGRTLFMVAEVFDEALDQCLAARRKYPFTE